MVDFVALRTIPIVQVSQYLGLTLKRSGLQLRGPCPICGRGSDRALAVTPRLNRFWCFGACKSGGDPLEMVARVRSVSYVEAAKVLMEQFGRPV